MSSESSAAVVIRDPDSSLRSWGAAGVFVVAIALASLPFGLGATLVGLVVIVAVALFKRASIQAALNWRAPQLELPAEQLELGSLPVVFYRRSARRPIDVSSFAVEYTVTCEEQVSYTQGSDTRHVTSTVYEHTELGEGSGTAEGVEAQLVLDISAYYGAPSMDLSNNVISWKLEIGITEDGLPSDTHRFDIEVAPVMADDLRLRPQDS